jgi:hypothetical protein
MEHVSWWTYTHLQIMRSFHSQKVLVCFHYTFIIEYEWTKKDRKIMQRLKTENKHDLQSHYVHGAGRRSPL